MQKCLRKPIKGGFMLAYDSSDFIPRLSGFIALAQAKQTSWWAIWAFYDFLFMIPSETWLLFYIPAAVSLPSSPPSSSSLPHLPPLPPSTPLPFLFRKGQTSHEYQPNMAYQVAVRLSSFLCFTAGKGDPIWGMGSQSLAKESEVIPAPTVRNPIRPSYTAIMHLQRA